MLVKLGIIIFGHAHLHNRTDSQALRVKYCIVDIPRKYHHLVEFEITYNRLNEA